MRIRSNIERAAEAAAEMAVKAYQAAMAAIQTGPSEGGYSRVLTIDEVQVGGISLAPTASIDSAQAIATSGKKTDGGSGESGGDETKGDVTYNFTQNNYSPEALDATTIYRQTNNQFAQFGKVVS